MSRNPDAEAALSTLRDLPGVVGSFVVSQAGGVLAQDLPSYFGSAAYDVAPRAIRLREALASGNLAGETCILSFGSHQVWLRTVGGALLSVLSESSVNQPALRMATNLLARQLEGVVLEDAQTEPQVPTRRHPPGRQPPTDQPPGQQQGSARTAGGPERMPIPSSPDRGAGGAPEAPASPQNSSRALLFRGRRVR